VGTQGVREGGRAGGREGGREAGREGGRVREYAQGTCTALYFHAKKIC